MTAKKVPGAHAESWRSRIVESGAAPPDQLLANPANWRIHPKPQQRAVAGALEQVGWVAQVLVNRRTGHVVDGHLRVELALSRGEPSVPVLYVDLSEEEERLVLATLDPLAAMAGAEATQLESLLAGLMVDDEGLREMLQDLARQHGHYTVRPGLTDPDAVPAVPQDPYVQAGDLWQLGGHRLLCGDATDASAVARLLGGAEPALMVTDPPYGVDYDPAWRNEIADGRGVVRSRRLGRVRNDDRADWTDAWHLSPAKVIYVWHGGLHAGVVSSSLERAGFEIRSQLIWVKPKMVFGRGSYHWHHEPCWYAVRHGAGADWAGDRKQTTVWEMDHLDHKSTATSDDPWAEHATQKPVEAMERPIRNHRGDVYDPFVGSGTTLIAGERLGRACYAMEIDPRYVQVAIERWQAYTGRTAERIDG